MAYLDGSGLARLWEKIKNTFADTDHVHGNHNVFSNYPKGAGDAAKQEDKTDADNCKFLNHISDGKVKSSHRIGGGGGTTIVTDDMNTDMFDGSITITSTGMNIGTFTQGGTDLTVTIDTGFTETPKLFELYCTTDGSTVELVAECYPQLDAPFNYINHLALPISSIDFDGGVATINWHTSTGLKFMWQAYI